MKKAKNSIYGVTCAGCNQQIRRGSYVCAFEKERLVSHWRCKGTVEKVTEALREVFYV